MDHRRIFFLTVYGESANFEEILIVLDLTKCLDTMTFMNTDLCNVETIERIVNEFAEHNLSWHIQI